MEDFNMAEEITQATTDTDAGENTATETGSTNTANDSSQTETLKKLIQSGIDKGLAEERKKYADLQKKFDKMTKEGMNKEELAKFELDERDKQLTAREKELNDRQNRWNAMEAIKEAGLDDGGKDALELVDFVISDDEETTKARVKAFSNLVKKFVKAEVDRTFKTNGRNPDNGVSGGKETKTSIATNLGKAAAERNTAAKGVLEHYLGG
jgi:hypothetical protein